MAPAATAADSPDTLAPAPRTRRRAARAATSEAPQVEAAATQDDAAATTAPASRRRRTTRAAVQQELAPLSTPEPSPTPEPTPEPATRTSRGRRGRRTSEAAVSEAAVSAGSDEFQTPAPAAPVILGAPVEEVADAATPPVHGTHGAHSRRGRHNHDAAPASATADGANAAAMGAAASAETMREPAHAASEAAAAPEAHEPPASPYRFTRRRRTDERAAEAPAQAVTAEAAQQPAVTPAAPMTPATPAAEEHPAPTEMAVEPALDAPRAYEPGMRPLRRQDRPGWGARDRAIPGAAPAEPYRRNGDQGRGAPPRSNQQRNAPNQGPAPRGPYMPGGRGQHAANPPYEPNQPNQPYAGPASGAPANGGYPPYTSYDQYQGYAPGAPADQQQRTTAAPVRPLRGRGYGGQQGYDQRGPRGTNRGMQDNYRDQQGGRDRYAGRHGMNDRRGVTDRRGAMGRQGRDRDRGYSNAAPYAGPTNTPTESRYEGRYGRIAGPAPVVRTVDVSGLLWLGGGSGMGPAEILDGRTLLPIARMNPEDVRRMGLRSGDEVRGRAEERNNRRIVVAVESVNDVRPEELRERPLFEQLTASFPDRRIRLEQGAQPISSRIIDLFSPLGFGSRALIVAPPKTGKTTLIREAAESVLKGYPNAVVMAVLVGERPEEVTDLRARLEPRGGLVYAASFDEDTQRHAWLVQVAVERAKRVAESGRDAFMVLDSLTRLARAENLATRGQGRTLSGGIDAQALDTGRRAFGAARNLEEGGSITILATCLVDTGSRQDDVVYEEFKGTGNMELHLSRELAQRRLFPAVDAVKSGTRREEMLLTPEELRAATALRRRLADLPVAQATQQLLSVMERTPSNSALLQAIEQSGWTGSAR